MKVYEYFGKNLNEVKIEALKDLNAQEEELYIRETLQETGFLKMKSYKLEVVLKDEVIKYVKEFIVEVSKMMGINVEIEVKKRENHVQFNLFSDNSAILIGKNGKNIEALQTLAKNSIFNKTGFKVNIIIDVEDYREKLNRNLEKEVKKIAYEVRSTGVEAKLDAMNSYERRIVHNCVGKINGVCTVSEGEEPNRYITIKKEEES